jgi:DNA-binding NtrC family response regulator
MEELPMHKLKVLIADDMPHVRNDHEHAIRTCAPKLLRPEIEFASSAEKAIELVRESIRIQAPFDLALIDIDFGEEGKKDGFSAVNEIHSVSPNTTLVIVSALGTDANMSLANQNPWVERFFNRDELTEQDLRRICEFALLRRGHARGEMLRPEHTLFTQAAVMQDFIKKLDRIPTGPNVIIFGPSGTGKEFAAKRLNANAKLLTGQASRPLITINCGGVADTIKESEIFGHVRGAYTGADKDRVGLIEQADGGDIFLDEFQNAPHSFQQLLLRSANDQVIVPLGSNKPKQVNVRFIVALNEDITEAKASGKLRKDLIERFFQNYLIIPPLKDRAGDIAALTEHFRKLHNASGKRFSPDAIEFLESCPWPMNVRQLKNIVVNALDSTKIPLITASTLQALESVREMLAEGQDKPAADSSTLRSPVDPKVHDLAIACIQADASLPETIKNFEKSVLTQHWAQEKSIAKVSRRTKVPESTLKRKLTEYGIDLNA